MSNPGRWTAFLWIVNLVCCTFGMAVNERTDETCPSLHVEDRRFSDSLDRPLAITGFDLTEKFLLRKGTVAEDRASFRLGSIPLIKPTESVFPNGLPSEYSFVTLYRLRRTTKKDRWFLWQIFDQTGGTQVSLVVDGAKRAVEFSFQGLQKNALHYTFKGRDLHALFDRQWHKLGVAVQSTVVSLYVDCKLAERRQTEDKADIKRSGRTLVTTRVEDGRPVDIEVQQILIYCDPYMAEMENCCELQEAKWGANKTSDETPAPPVTGRLPLMLSLPAPPPLDGCPCPAEKCLEGDSVPEGAGDPKGDKGDTGLAGVPGNTIEGKCLKGDQGPAGERGEKGDAGTPGQPGKEGKRGKRGKNGDPTNSGSSGVSAGATVKGDKGEKGDAILRGEKGGAVCITS
ncbi:collagen alpha-1(XIX) chain isoform X1 [Gadus morhua]|uniref:collagen alpha-1(XIX) chain isoform X1 n=1 Tax=Gadus morhua TaxID=8049 RepID=UPI0011B7E99D|nr:collagen alpha-1(XIX) chain-like isoform X1 [Gadus morhua]XP_030234433.1 collagen alpha-1(XIX) chain-like isoform X1 [Gadus morhua]